MVRHTHQDYLLNGTGGGRPLPLPISMPESALDAVRDVDTPKDLFDFGVDGYIRKIPLSSLDRDMDDEDVWECFVSRVEGADSLLLLDDRAASDNPIVRDFDTFTKQRYLAALEARGIHATIVKPGG